MFDNPQKEVNNTSKKLRPVKMSDEEFELFYKEILAEFGPKPVAPVEPDPVEEEFIEIIEEIAEEPAEEVATEEIQEAAAEEPAAEPEEEDEEDAEAAIEAEIEAEANLAIQEEAAKAAAVIRNVQADEVIDGDTAGVKLVKPKKQKGIAGLVITLILELLAIGGIVAYWLLYLL